MSRSPAEKSVSNVSLIPEGGRENTITRSRTIAGDAAGPRIDMKYLIHALIKYNASDLHIRVGRPPLYRINGKIVATKMPELTQEQVTPARLAEAVSPLLDPLSGAARAQREGLALVRSRLGAGGAAARVAGIAAELIG